ncbi:MAG: hypothetical protein EZS26_001309 [Candidatus Ordinivivax streblomastigis]|uniref:Cell division protein FtsL n=1 Tax=Candidatus Ordinivivax streblomastigis TaxID=2540710 RepID=A0A5M8P200_9BACT|nr:MAG: hypothetical protein EZS26_001309 [Candidatus Ordinivivax streblomastigis]
MSKRNFRYFIIGDWLKEDFVIKQSKLLVLIVFLIIVFISNDYACQKKMKQIEILQDSLNNVKYENLTLSTRLTSASRQSQIESLLESKGLDLAAPQTPAFEIRK